MSKKYFVKSLRAEGEPKDGDMVIWEEVGWTKDYEKAKKSAPYGGKIPHKAKLFLCSRDVQVGDKIRAEYSATMDEDREVLREEDGYWVSGEGEDELYFEKDKSFKVIGEISPEATWVKEGDEFDEDEIEKWWYNIDKGIFEFKAIEPWTGSMVANTSSMMKYLQARYKIKGPCGHFH